MLPLLSLTFFATLNYSTYYMNSTTSVAPLTEKQHQSLRDLAH